MFADGADLTIDLGELRKVLKRRLEADSALMAWSLAACIGRRHRIPSPWFWLPHCMRRLDIDGLFGYAAWRLRFGAALLAGCGLVAQLVRAHA